MFSMKKLCFQVVCLMAFTANGFAFAGEAADLENKSIKQETTLREKHSGFHHFERHRHKCRKCPPGPTGPTGATGAVGQTGPTGPTGPAAPTGAGLFLRDLAEKPVPPHHSTSGTANFVF